MVSLHLDANKLEELPADAFDNLTQLETLHLNNNNLTEVPADLLNNKPSLHTLDLGHNNLSSIPASLLDGRTNLRTLDLYGNPLTGLPAGTFADLTNIQMLNLGALVYPGLCNYPQGVQNTILAQLPNISNCKLVTYAYVTAALDALPITPVCDRTMAVKDAMVNAVDGVTECADVTEAHLAGVTGTLALNNKNISSLMMGNLDGLSGRNCEVEQQSVDHAEWNYVPWHGRPAHAGAEQK